MDYSGNEIAIIGMDINMPQSRDVSSFWNNLVSSRECIEDVPSKYIDPLNKNKNFINRMSVCEDYDKFDAAFFGYSNHEAKIMDPQRRLFLQSCWHALENSGYVPSKINAKVGVFGSAGYNTYLINSILSSPDYLKNQGEYDVMLCNDKDFLSTSVSYKLGLTGLSVTVQTACSSSLVGVHLACQSLLTGESDLCLAGGVCVRVPSEQGYTYRPGFILSDDGHCRPFDSNASGTVFGSGVGVVVLKRLEDAINDRDTIYSIIKITSVNNDGNRKIGFTAPSQEGQEEAILNALYLEDIPPESIAFVEAHGTGTILGDPIELNAIKSTLSLDSEEKNAQFPCAIGSVKSNIGHMDTAAGIAGLIKACCSLYHKTIVPTLNFKKLNQNISFDHTRFYVPVKCEKIVDRDLPIRALVSALGVGGTNVSVILEEPPKYDPKPDGNQDEYIVKVSAKSAFSIQKMVEELSDLKLNSDQGSVFYTLNTGREDFDYKTYCLFKKNDDGKYVLINNSESRCIKEKKRQILNFIKQDEINIDNWLAIYNNVYAFRQYIDEWLQYLHDVKNYNFNNVYELVKESSGSKTLSMVLLAIVRLSFIQTVKKLVADVEYKDFNNNPCYELYLKKLITKGEFISRCQNDYEFTNPGYVEDDILIKNYDLSDLYKIIGELWQSKYEINWDFLYYENDKRRVAAPLYYFDKQRFWFKNNRSYVWTEKKVPCVSDNNLYSGNYLILSDNSKNDQVNALISMIKKTGADKIYVDTELINVNPTHSDDYLDEFIISNNLTEVTHLRVVSLYGISTCVSGYKAFYVLLQLLKKLNLKCKSISVVLLNQCDSDSPELIENTFVTGIANTVTKELPNIIVKQIVNCDSVEVVMSEQVLKQFCSYELTNKVIICGGNVYIPKYIKKDITENKAVLKDNGTYLITGGTGNVGLLFAKEISLRIKANLVLLSKHYTESDIYNDNSEKCRIIQSVINDIKKSGSNVVIIKSDVTDFDELKKTVETIKNRFKSINGLIHAAGKVGKAKDYIDNIKYSDVEAYAKAKINGALNLRKILFYEPMDFCIYLSSLVSILGGIGDSAYSGANAVLNYIALSNQNEKYPVVSVIFDYLLRVFPDKSVDEDNAQIKNVLLLKLEADEFSEAFDQIFNNINEKNIIITKTDLNQRYDLNFQTNTISGIDSNDKDRKTFLSKDEIKQRVNTLWHSVLDKNCDENKNFFDVGGDSLAAITLTEKLINEFNLKFSTKYIYEFSTISLMTEDLYLKINKLENKNDRILNTANTESDSVVVIGMSGRFPGADDINELWYNILNKTVSISCFNDEEEYNSLNAESDEKLNKYVRARGIIKDVDKFDYAFFGISKLEADLMDPQQRLFLECAWNAIEDAGCINLMEKYRVGVFASQGISSYLINVLLRKGKIKQDYNNIALINNSPDSLATKVSYLFNLTGISKTVQTFCSSSLVALEEAVDNIKLGRCDLAVVGGVNIVVPQKTGYIYNESSIFSSSGEVKPFDDSANGTVFSNGVGVVILSSREWANKHGISIYSGIVGVGINNDGSQKAGYLSPSIKGQSECIADVYSQTGLSPEKISYIETHGTATHVGDPIEVHSLTKSFKHFTDKTNYCALGSIKGNIGHLDRAGGITGFIKACLVSYYHCIPPITGFEKINRNISLEETPFYINKEKIQLDKSQDMYVGVNALGVGGTNVHVILKSYSDNHYFDSNRQRYIITLSAMCPESLDMYKERLYKYLSVNNEGVSNVAATLQVFRKHYKYREAIVAESQEELLKKLNEYGHDLLNEGPKKVNTLYVNIAADDNVIYGVLAELSKEKLFKEIVLNELKSVIPSDFQLGNSISDDLRQLQKNGFDLIKAVLYQYLSEIIKEKIVIIFDKFGEKKNNIKIDNRCFVLNIQAEKTKSDENKRLTQYNVKDFTNVIADIWNSGIEIDWNKYNYGNRICNSHIPGYAFKKSRCWVD